LTGLSGDVRAAASSLAPRRSVLAAVLGSLVLAACAPPPLPPMDAGRSSLPASSILLKIEFDFASWSLQPEAGPLLNTLAQALNDPQLAAETFRIEGHTDTSGALPRNMVLSRLRAATVKDQLVVRGVAASRLTTEGYGPLRLIPGLPLNSAQHRRVEVVRVN
jgi:outer membrane protein OmpA-like peptidoglycan-associated protein